MAFFASGRDQIILAPFGPRAVEFSSSDGERHWREDGFSRKPLCDVTTC
jgi:hypothetical protein